MFLELRVSKVSLVHLVCLVTLEPRDLLVFLDKRVTKVIPDLQEDRVSLDPQAYLD